MINSTLVSGLNTLTTALNFLGFWISSNLNYAFCEMKERRAGYYYKTGRSYCNASLIILLI